MFLYKITLNILATDASRYRAKIPQYDRFPQCLAARRTMFLHCSLHMKLLNKRSLIFPVTTPTKDLGQNIRKNCSFSFRLLFA